VIFSCTALILIVFHHDGPFDACNPHRNRKTKAAPMQAFPEGSANNTMGGSGPVNKHMDLDRYHGRVPDGFHDFNSVNVVPPPMPETSRVQRPSRQDRQPSADRGWDGKQRIEMIDGRQKIEMVHGEQSMGLGTSTFLEGAPVPASRLALQRATSEQDNGGGLSRKKSIVQRFRGMSRPRQQQGFGDAGRVLSPEARYVYVDDGQTPPVPSIDPQMRGRPVEVNPFFNEQGGNIVPGRPKETLKSPPVEKSDTTARSRGLSSPQMPLYRTKTNDSNGANDIAESKPTLLSRVKSLRQTRRVRPERRETSN
jgi:hypothetical protein